MTKFIDSKPYDPPRVIRISRSEEEQNKDYQYCDDVTIACYFGSGG
jgi:hypothetical protein